MDIFYAADYGCVELRLIVFQVCQASFPFPCESVRVVRILGQDTNARSYMCKCQYLWGIRLTQMATQVGGEVAGVKAEELLELFVPGLTVSDPLGGQAA